MPVIPSPPFIPYRTASSSRRKILFLAVALVACNFLRAQAKETSSNEDSVKVAILQEITVTSKRPPIQLLPDKTVVNVDAAVTNTGATLLEVLEKSPCVTIDRRGNITLKGKQGVLIMIDGKPSQVSGNDLNNLLRGMAASEVDQQAQM